MVRGGYGRQYGRLNGVDLVLGAAARHRPHPACAVHRRRRQRLVVARNNTASSEQCISHWTEWIWSRHCPRRVRHCHNPTFLAYNAIAAGAGEGLDPHFRPNVIDSFDFTIQRQLSRKVTLELGYIGRRITHEYLPLDINAVPYMMTLGGQTLRQCLQERSAAILRRRCRDGRRQLRRQRAGAVTPQPFFETALAGTGYCTPGTCTATMVANEGGNLANATVWDLWSDLDKGVGCPARHRPVHTA